MEITDNEPEEVDDHNTPGRNFKNALISFGLILLSLASFIGIDYLSFPLNDVLFYTLTILYYLFMTLAALVAFVTLRNSFIALRTSGNAKNYIATGITIIVLLAVGSEILGRV